MHGPGSAEGAQEETRMETAMQREMAQDGTRPQPAAAEEDEEYACGMQCPRRRWCCTVSPQEGLVRSVTESDMTGDTRGGEMERRTTAEQDDTMTSDEAHAGSMHSLLVLCHRWICTDVQAHFQDTLHISDDCSYFAR